jgi:hypothetical protein
MKTKLTNPILIASIVFLSISASAGLYEHLFGIPEMLNSPSTMITKSNNDLGQAAKFWIPVHFLILITLVMSLIFNWKSPIRKKLVLSAFICYMYITVISIFFAKKLEVFKTMSDNIDFQQQTSLWLQVSWHRPVLMIVIELLMLIALSRPFLNRQN